MAEVRKTKNLLHRCNALKIAREVTEWLSYGILISYSVVVHKIACFLGDTNTILTCEITYLLYDSSDIIQ